MSKARTHLTGLTRLSLALVFGIALLPGAAKAQDDTAKIPAQWCQVDDPADWRIARDALIEKGIRDLSDIPCPARESGVELPQQLTLPMPCGRAMVFRRVDVPVAHPLDHVEGNFGRAIDISAETPQTVLSNGAWTQTVSGAFSINTSGKQASSDALNDLSAKSYYMAKYELTALQWSAFEMGLLDLPFTDTASADLESCAPFQEMLENTDLRRIRPKGGLTWFDAVEFSRAYSNWLIAYDQTQVTAGKPPSLPWEQGATGYVRLPTEAEWEFAARGGVSYVTPQSRSLRLPMVKRPGTDDAVQPNLAEVCTEPPRDINIKTAAVGQTLANTLGLYDVVCNAEEIMLDLFRITRPDGLGGQVGGMITKGGNSVLLREQNTVGRRIEAQALFTTQGEASTSTIGARYMISAPVFVGRRDAQTGFVEGLPNAPFETALMKGREELLDAGVALDDGDDNKELEAEVNKLRRAISERELTQSELQDRVAELQIEVDRMNARLRKAAQEEVLLSIRSAVITANLVDRVGRNMAAGMDRVQKLRKTRPQTDDTRKALDKADKALDLNRTRIAAAYDVYLQVHGELAQLQPDFVERQIFETQRGLGGTDTTVFSQYLTLFEQHQKQIRNNRGRISETMRRAWLDQLDPAYEVRRRLFPDQQPER